MAYSAKSTNGQEMFGKSWDDKMRLLDAIDDMRRPVAASARPEKADLQEQPQNCETIQSLREKLHIYEKTCAMLEQEVHILEEQTLAALAEAGRLRRELDKSEAEKKRCSSGFLSHAEKDNMRQIISDAENERKLLLEALENSESELARMVHTLDVVVRKFQVA